MKDNLRIPFSKLFDLVRNPFFIKLTLVGNSIIFLFSFVFHHLEGPVNPKVVTHLDSIWWSFATATTVGYGDITPVTTGGKVLGILLMLTGTGLFATFTAFFADFFLGRNDSSIEKQLHELNKKIEKMEDFQK
jgi:voltage-gated potassium channel